MNDETMLPCPFCGGAAVVVGERHDHGGFYITCSGVGCQCAYGECYDRDAMPDHQFAEAADAISAWNTRAQASAPEGVDAIAWESTTPAYFKYITQAKYDKISDAAKQWYKPYRCSDCTNAPEGGVVACWRYLNAEGEVVTEWIDGTPPDKHFDLCGNEIFGGSVEVAYTRSNAKAGEVDESEVREEMSPEFTDSARAALLWVLWHHQGGSSDVGQPIRFALGMGAHEHLSNHQIDEAKRWAAITRRDPPTHDKTKA